RAVTADQKTAAHAPDSPGFQIAQAHARGSLPDPDVFDHGAVDDAAAGLRGRVLEQDRFEKDLVDAMRRLGRRPVAVRAVLRREAVAAAGDRNPRQLLPGERRAIAGG